MGRFLFDLPEDWELKSRQASSVHVVGLDGVPWPCKVNVDGQTLIIERNRDESGHVFLAFPFSEFGEIVVATGTLPESPQSYCLVTELARGTANRLRNQISIWEEGGLKIGEDVREKTASAVKLLGSAILQSDKKTKSETARKSLEASMAAIFVLGKQFGDQILPIRTAQATEARFWVGVRAGLGPHFQSSLQCQFADLVQVPSDSIKSLTTKKPVVLGPFLDASVDGMSDRLLQLDDFEARKSHLLAHTREVLKELPPTVKLLHAACGLNGTGHRHLSYPQELQFTTDLLQTIEDSSTDLPVMVSFDFPWAEKLAWSVGGTHPLQIADSLLRRGARISMLGLDVNLDYWPNGSAVRDPLQWIELVDIWSQLGLPLVVCLRIPSGGSAKVDLAQTMSGGEPGRKTNFARSSMSDMQRQRLLEVVVPMIIARPSVHGIILQQWNDGDDLRFAGGGLVDVNGDSKELGAFWSQIGERLKQR